MKFDSKQWENQGQGKQLRGHRIIVRQYNQGKDANFYLEAWGDAYARMRGKKPAPAVGKTIPGKGPAARDAAILAALDLAATGLYECTPPHLTRAGRRPTETTPQPAGQGRGIAPRITRRPGIRARRKS